MRSARPLPSTLQPRTLSTAICLALSLLGGTASLPLQAAEPASSVAAPSVPAGPLDQALNLFAEQAGITLSYSPQMVHGLRSPGVAEGESLDDGLRLLLAGTGLVAEKTASGYVVRLSQSDASYQLEPMTIKATLAPGAFEPVPGYFASNASSATKSDKPILETAQSISVVTAEQMADRKVDRVEDAVAYSAGVRVGSSGLDPRFDQINIRGFETTMSADFLDGLRQPYNGWLSIYGAEAFALERVEVLKGPASVLYGQISPGGMVNRVSKRPSVLAKNQVEIQGGSHDHRQGQFDVGGKLDEDGDVLFRTVGVYRDAQYDIEQLNNDVRLLAPSLSWQIDSATSLTLLAQYQERETAASPMLYQDGDHLTDFWQGDEYFDKLGQRQWTFGYEFEHAFNDSLSVQQNLRYGQLNTTNQYLQPNGTITNGVMERDAVGVYEDMDSLTSDTRLVNRFATGELQHTLLSGWDYTWFDSSVLYATGPAPSIDMGAPDYHQPVSKPTAALADQDSLTQRSGLYLQDQIELERWRLSVGVRRDWVHVRNSNNLTDTHTKTSDSATTYQLGALYLFDNGLAPYTSYAESFLPQSGSNASGPLKPTEGKQYEVGLKYQPPGTSAMFTASLYHLTQENVSTRDPVDPLNTVQTGEQVSRGLELEAVADLNERLSLTAGYSYNDPEVTKSNDGNEGKDPKDVPRHLVSLWLDYNLPSGLGFGGGARYTGSVYGNDMNTVKSEDYTLVDAVVRYDFGGGLDGVRVALNARNLFDKQYINCQAGFCYRGEARSLVTSLSYSW
ncbi:iron complex outermembrane recepter protein [Pseudomonas cuatrocienegasensis]|uniref:Iron complex outermembrane recepter protein n=1 Tax=Pseudomonas cuatrocienegasensis TaxID=543360 RepID=A0ABY1BHY1_9PSED|nr:MULTISPECIES: TonB-dependent siderophore receptor [Pseudomonas]SEQ90666.1 iron complex outermembrane recepter protein [Pseudomonas cuatrocienegasensis]